MTLLFLQPAWLLLLLLSPLVVLLHLIRHRPVIVSSNFLWERAGVVSPVSRGRGRPRVSVPLLLQILAIALIAVSLARPIVERDGYFDHHIFIIDASASMQARKPGSEAEARSSPFERARDELQERISRVPDTALSTVITVDARPRVIAARVGGDDVRALLEGLVANDTPSDWPQALRILAHLLEDEERTSATVLTDDWGREEVSRALEVSYFDADRITIHAFGGSVENAGLRGISVLPPSAEDDAWLVEGAVIFTGADEWRGTVSVSESSGGEELGRANVRATPERPGAFRIRVLEAVPPGVLEVRLPSDAMPHDDSAHVVINEPRGQVRTLLLGPSHEFLARALRSVPGVELEVTRTPPPEIDEFDLVVVHRATLETTPETHTVWIDAAPPNTVTSDQQGLTIDSWAEGHPLSHGIDWSELDVSRGNVVSGLSSPQAIVSTQRHALLQASVTPTGALVVASFPLDASNWPELGSFPRFFANLVLWIAPYSGRRVQSSCVSGRPCAVPRIGSSTPLLSPPAMSSADRSEPPPDLAATLGNGFEASFVPMQRGVYTAGSGEASYLVPVDALHLSESVPAEIPQSVEASASPASRPSDTSPFPDLPLSLWRWFMVLALAFFALEFGWAMSGWFAVRRSDGGRRRRAWAHALTWGTLSLLACLALGLALMRAPFPHLAEAPRHVLVVEDSEVLEEASARRLDRLRQLPAEGGRFRNLSVLELVTAGPADSVPAAAEAFRADAWSAALEAAAGLLGADDRSALGWATIEQPPDALVSQRISGFRAAGHGVSHFPLDARLDADVMVGPILGPARAYAQVPYEIQGQVYSQVASDSRVRVLREGEVVDERTVRLDAGWNRLTMLVMDEDAGEHTYEVEVEVLAAADPLPENNRNGVVIDTVVGPLVGIVSGSESSAGTLSRALQVHGYRTEWLEPQDAPTEFQDWLRFDAVLLDDVPAVALSRGQQRQLEAWVRDFGGGLLIAGGENAFGPGGYYHTALEEISPLSSEIPRERPQLALVIVLDRSGSMARTVGGASRLQVAEEATYEALNLLSPDSLAAVVAFDSRPSVVIPLQPVGDASSMREALSGMVAGGGTSLQPALVEALEQLRGVDVSPRHIVALTDGLTQAGDFDEFLEALRQEGVSLSTVGIGQGAALDRLQILADEGGGTFHATREFEALPSILVQEVLMLISEPVRHEQVTPVWSDRSADFLSGLPDSPAPLRGFVRTSSKEGATVHMRTQDGDPLLASWRYGGGRVAAFASHAAGEWARDWLAEPSYALTWAQVLRWAQERSAVDRLTVFVQRHGDKLLIEAESLDERSRPHSSHALAATAVSPSGASIEMPMTPSHVYEGTYEAAIPIREAGKHVISVEQRARAFREAELAEARATVHVGYPSSVAISADRLRAAAVLAQAAGSSVARLPEDAFPSRGSSLTASPAVDQWAALALGLFLSALMVRSLWRTRR